MLWPIVWGRKWPCDSLCIPTCSPGLLPLSIRRTRPRRWRRVTWSSTTQAAAAWNRTGSPVSLRSAELQQPGASWDATLGGGVVYFAASLWQWLTDPLMIKTIVLTPASPSHPKNEEGQRAKDISQMSFSSLKTHIEATPATSACISLARSVSKATLNERVCREVGIF